MNETSAVKNQSKSQIYRDNMVAKGSESLKQAVAEGFMKKWTAFHMVQDGWSHNLQDMVVDILRGEVASKAIESVGGPHETTPYAKNFAPPVDASGKVDMNIKPAKKAKKVKVAGRKDLVVPTNEEDAFEASVNAEVNS